MCKENAPRPEMALLGIQGLPIKVMDAVRSVEVAFDDEEIGVISDLDKRVGPAGIAGKCDDLALGFKANG